MKSFYDLVIDLDRRFADWVATLSEVQPEDLGLDRRAAYRLYVSEEGIAVHKSHDNTLQYYGGFEYIDKDLRHVYGDWVFYEAEADRVNECLAKFEEEVNV